uniref:Integrase catalytic domain-containing protein n=1 Tax=Poecilia mexicana TaxID=48701 RepID=A0A3B3X627_9TELE
MTDWFTRYSWAVPTKDQTAQTTVQVLWSHVIQTFGCPARFHTDRGPNFESALMQELCKCYGIIKSRTIPYHPAGNGSVERMNQTLLNMLRSLGAERQHRWPEYLPELLQAYNNTIHGSTGYAPSFLMFGRHLRQPVDVGLGVEQPQSQCDKEGWVKDHHAKLSFAYGLAKQHMAKVAACSKRQYDRKTQALPLAPGERVWVRDRNRKGQGKLHPGWSDEPHVILEQVGKTGVVYKVQPERGGREKMLHRNALKLCIAPLKEEPQLVADKKSVVETN